MDQPRVYEEIVDLIAAGHGPGIVVAFRPSETVKSRVADLVAREKAGGLTAKERTELDQYGHLEHMMRLAKARAHQFLAAK